MHVCTDALAQSWTMQRKTCILPLKLLYGQESVFGNVTKSWGRKGRQQSKAVRSQKYESGEKKAPLFLQQYPYTQMTFER